jgi:anti-sigma B factor antagonist
MDMDMKFQNDGETLRVSAVPELSAANANSFRDETRHAFGGDQRNIEIDLSETAAVDSCGLGALVALHKTTSGRGGVLRLLNPTPSVQQILELTRMHRIFEVVRQ